MKVNKLLTWAMMSIAILFGSVFAASFDVVNLDVQKDNGDYLLLVSLQNANTSEGLFDEVKFTIEEFGTTFNAGVVKLDNTDVTVLTYNLKDVAASYDQLKKGETYIITAATSTDSKNQAFLFGTEKESDEKNLILETVKVNSLDVNDVDTVQFMNGESLNIALRFTALSTFDDARIMVFMDGYEHNLLSDTTDVFSAVEGKTYVKTLNIELPADMDSQDDYLLRIVGANGLSGITYKELSVYVDTSRHRVDVLDLVMTPSNGVEAGQNMIANVRLKNMGQKNQESVKVTIAVPELGISESSYVTNLNTDTVITSDDMLLFVPETAVAGIYTTTVTLSYNDGYTETAEDYSFNVVAPRTVEEDNLLVSFKNNADFSADSTIEIVVANPNSESKPISLVPVDNAWSDVEVTPTLAMVQGGSSATFVVKVNAKNGASGEKEIALVVKEGANTVNEFTINGFVESSDDSQIDWLNVALVVLLIIAIVVLLSLVVSIAKRRNDKEDDELSSNEEYY